MTSQTWVATTEGKQRKRGSSAFPKAEEWRELEVVDEAEGEPGMKEERWGVEGELPFREREMQFGRPKRE